MSRNPLKPPRPKKPPYAERYCIAGHKLRRADKDGECTLCDIVDRHRMEDELEREEARRQRAEFANPPATLRFGNQVLSVPASAWAIHNRGLAKMGRKPRRR